MKDYRMRIAAVAAVVGMLATLLLIVPAQASGNVQILSPSPSATVSGTVAIKVKCTDSAGLKLIDVRAGANGHGFHGWINPPYPTTYTFTFLWHTAQESNGAASIVATGTNINSEIVGSVSAVVVKNIKPPIVSWQAPPSPSYFKDTVSSTQLKCLVKKSYGTAINKVQIFIDNKYKTQTYYSPPKNGLSFTWTYSLNLQSLSLGKHIITVRAYNTSGGHAEAEGTIYRRH